MRTLMVIETVKELSDLFKEGKLDGCTLVYAPRYEMDDDYVDLVDSSNYILSDELKQDSQLFIEQLFGVAGIPVQIN